MKVRADVGVLIFVSSRNSLIKSNFFLYLNPRTHESWHISCPWYDSWLQSSCLTLQINITGAVSLCRSTSQYYINYNLTGLCDLQLWRNTITRTRPIAKITIYYKSWYIYSPSNNDHHSAYINSTHEMSIVVDIIDIIETSAAAPSTATECEM